MNVGHESPGWGAAQRPPGHPPLRPHRCAAALPSALGTPAAPQGLRTMLGSSLARLHACAPAGPSGLASWPVWLAQLSARRWLGIPALPSQLGTGAACLWGQGVSGVLVSACLGCSRPGGLYVSWSIPARWGWPGRQEGCAAHPTLAVGAFRGPGGTEAHCVRPTALGFIRSPRGAGAHWASGSARSPAAMGGIGSRRGSAGPRVPRTTRIFPGTGCPPETCALIGCSA